MTFVPPDMSTSTLLSNVLAASCIAWSTRLMLPAVPMSMVIAYLRLLPGFMVSSLEPREFPMISEPVISATAWTAVQ